MQASFLDDATLLFERAQKHMAEFRSLSAPASIWRTTKMREGATGEWVHTLEMNRPALRLLKPVMADAANNFVHALDQIASAACRLRNEARNTEIYFPLGAADEEYARRAKRIAPFLPEGWLEMFAAVRDKHRLHTRHFDVIKKVSNTSKHWALAANDASAMAISWHPPGERQRIVNLPRDQFANNDRFEFHRGQTPIESEGLLIVIGLRVSGIDDDLAMDAGSLLDIMSRFLADMIAEARHLGER